MSTTYAPTELDNPILGLFFGESDTTVNYSGLIVGTANVKDTLDNAQALTAIHKIIAHKPHVFGLEEWAAGRGPVLDHIKPEYHSHRAGGGGPVVWDPKRLHLAGVRLAHIAPEENVGHLPGRRDVLPASELPIYTFHDKVTDETFDFRICHLTAEVQIGDHYRQDAAHAKRVARHKRERENLLRYAKQGGYIVGDTNFAGMTLPPMHSCWEGHPSTGTFGNRTIDYVYALKRSKEVNAYHDPSDHKFVIAKY